MDFKLNLINEYLKEYTDEVEEDVVRVAEEVGKEALVKIKNASPKNTGEYAKSWKIKKIKTSGTIRIVLHNKKHKLTHLLEYGHKTRNGGQTRKFRHIKPVKDWVSEEFQKRLESVIGGKK